MSSNDDALNFLEHCILVGSGSPQTSDGEYINNALRGVAAAFWPDLLAGAVTTFNVETGEIMVETPTALYYVAVRAVSR